MFTNGVTYRWQTWLFNVHTFVARNCWKSLQLAGSHNFFLCNNYESVLGVIDLFVRNTRQFVIVDFWISAEAAGRCVVLSVVRYRTALQVGDVFNGTTFVVLQTAGLTLTDRRDVVERGVAESKQQVPGIGQPRLRVFWSADWTLEGKRQDFIF